MTTVRCALIQTTCEQDMNANLRQPNPLSQRGSRDGCSDCLPARTRLLPLFLPTTGHRLSEYGTEPVPDGRILTHMQELAARNGIVLVVPLFEREQAGIYYNTAAVIDADGRYLGKYRKCHIPQVISFYEKYYFRPGNLGYPVFQTKYAAVEVYICYDRHFPEGARCLGLGGAEIVFIPAAASRGRTFHLWHIEQPALAIANGYWVGSLNRLGRESLGENDFLAIAISATRVAKLLPQRVRPSRYRGRT